MPVMDGYDTMRAIREIDEFEALPIIAVTGKVMAGERQRCIDAGRERLRAEAGRHRRAPRRARAMAAGPGQAAHDRPLRSAGSRRRRRSPNARAVLVVDDTAAQRLALRAVLQPLGYTIVEADSGLAALRCVMEQDFAVILLDVCMPEMDGFETAAPASASASSPR